MGVGSAQSDTTSAATCRDAVAASTAWHRAVLPRFSRRRRLKSCEAGQRSRNVALALQHLQSLRTAPVRSGRPDRSGPFRRRPFLADARDAPIGYFTGSSSLYPHSCPRYVPNRERELRRIIKSTGGITQVTVAVRTIRGRDSGQKAKVDTVVVREQVPFRLIPRPALPRTPVLGTSVDFLPQDKRLLPRTKLLRLTSEGTGGTQAQWRRRSKGKGKALEAEAVGTGEDMDVDSDSAQASRFTQDKIERAAKRVATKAVGVSIGIEHLLETTAFIEDGRLLREIEIEMDGERSE
ncbi:hypothetical protein EHS25_005493 [Saitozyma podzolica]|uniref:Uncharacterized protein n=1 Tax=Saitozyma podzolica TaxID=1890683 RepID=A0A427XYC2_9TREE|nr:hypothetical protein EHS25_005493 [Saitozyma podzolica]